MPAINRWHFYLTCFLLLVCRRTLRHNRADRDPGGPVYLSHFFYWLKIYWGQLFSLSKKTQTSAVSIDKICGTHTDSLSHAAHRADGNHYQSYHDFLSVREMLPGMHAKKLTTDRKEQLCLYIYMCVRFLEQRWSAVLGYNKSQTCQWKEILLMDGWWVSGLS